MKADIYSIWLMPDETWAREFGAIANDLAGRFKTPRFHPHLTLVGGQPFDRAELARRAASVVSGAAPISRPILDVVIGDAFFRSFYALFEAEGVLLDLRQRAWHAALGEAPGDFMPHVSLLYGSVEPARKAAAAAEMRAKLEGRTARFDRIGIVRSGDDVPVEEWETVDVFRLEG